MKNTLTHKHSFTFHFSPSGRDATFFCRLAADDQNPPPAGSGSIHSKHRSCNVLPYGVSLRLPVALTIRFVS